MVNIYKSKKVEKYLPKEEDEQKEFTGIKLNSRILFLGASGSGKTNALIQYLLETSKPKKGTFKHIFLCYKTDEPLYDMLKEELGPNFITCYKSVAEFPDAQQFADHPEDEHYLVIFDDCINDKDKVSRKKMADYFTYGRKKHITCCFLAQSYYSTDKFFRQQMTYMIITSINSIKDLKAILKEYQIGKIQLSQIVSMFEKATDKTEDPDDLPFFKMDLNSCPLNKKFSKNFLEYFNPDDFT